jgi:hypothetical protein
MQTRSLFPKPTVMSALFRDLAAGFQQQMFFWGRDVLHPAGNIFLSHGFQKRKSTGHQGTSCYSFTWQDGVIELHGSHAGWFGKGGGFLYVRPLRRCVRWLTSAPPIPGHWPKDACDLHADESMHAMAQPFLSWWLAHEQAVTRRTGLPYRAECYRQFKKLPKARAWLAPEEAQRWVSGLRDSPATLRRASRHRPCSL